MLSESYISYRSSLCYMTHEEHLHMKLFSSYLTRKYSQTRSVCTVLNLTPINPNKIRHRINRRLLQILRQNILKITFWKIIATILKTMCTRRMSKWVYFIVTTFWHSHCSYHSVLWFAILSFCCETSLQLYDIPLYNWFRIF